MSVFEHSDFLPTKKKEKNDSSWFPVFVLSIVIPQIKSVQYLKIQPDLIRRKAWTFLSYSAVSIGNDELKKVVSIFYEILNHEQQELLSGIYDREHHIIMAQWRHTRI